MNKKALFFPGQASQYVGMGRDLYDSSDAVKKLYELASDEMRLDIARLSFEGPAEELKRTHITQPAILLHSLSVLTVMGDNLPDFDYAAGHSLGEYGALAVCGALSFEDAIRAVIKRAALMEEACQQNEGTMAAIMGLNIEQVRKVCETAAEAGMVVPANFNSDIQIVVSGSVAGVEKAIELAKESGAKRAMKIEVGGAFHSPLMEPARLGLSEYLANIVIQPPTRPVVANVTGQPAEQPEDIRKLLVQQLTAPVKWAQTMAYLKNKNVTEIIEIGPGKVLTGLAKRAMQPENMINLDRLEDISNFVPVI